MLKIVSEKDVIKYTVYLSEHLYKFKLPACSKAVDHKVDSVVAIIDCSGLSMALANKKVLNLFK